MSTSGDAGQFAAGVTSASTPNRSLDAHNRQPETRGRRQVRTMMIWNELILMHRRLQLIETKLLTLEERMVRD